MITTTDKFYIYFFSQFNNPYTMTVKLNVTLINHEVKFYNLEI